MEPGGEPSATVYGGSDWEPIQIRYSHYWPPAGGVNTSRPDAPHLARTASGARWQDWVGVGVACDFDWPFGTQIKAFGQTWVCVDRGGMIQAPWVDFLVEVPHAAYGEMVDAYILFD